MIKPTSSTVLAVDVGGTNVRAAIVTVDSDTLRVRLPGDLTTDIFRAAVPSVAAPQEFADCIVKVALKAAQKSNAAPTAMAVGQPGEPLADGSVANLAAFVATWGEGVASPVGPALRKAFPSIEPSRVCVFDDAACAAAAEVKQGAARLANTALVVTVGTGVGSSVWLDTGRKEHVGARGMIELGHTFVPQPPMLPASVQPCPCGQIGCLESYCGGRAIAHLARQIVPPGDLDQSLSDADVVRVVCDMAGDDVSCENPAVTVVEIAAHALASAVHNATRILDPDTVVFCGPLAERLLPRVRMWFRNRVWTLHNDAAHIPFQAAVVPEPGIAGAAALLQRQINRDAATTESAARPSGTCTPSYRLRRADPAADLDGLYNVCLKTGDAGNDASALFNDKQILGTVYVGPYAVLSTDFAFALVDDTDPSRIVGYTLAVLDTAAFAQKCEREWWPPLREGPYSPERVAQLQPNEKELAETFTGVPVSDPNSDVPCHPTNCPLSPEVLAKYPSHLHIDLLPEAQSQGCGTVMICRLLDALRGAGSVGVHLTQAATNDRAFAFYTKLGFELTVKGDSDWTLTKAL